MSAVLAVTTAKFLRKTTLRETEGNKNFRMLDDDVAEAITSAAADEVTPLMSKVYTRLILTPAEWREGERVLRFAGQEREGKWVTAWEQLRRHLRVSSETASKALRWMHRQGIIGYYSGKNGVGIRIFLNRAANSVAQRREAKSQKNLSLVPASDGLPHTSPSETPLNDSFAVSEVLDSDVNSRAPKNGAGNQSVLEKRLEKPSRSFASIPEPRLNESLSSHTAPHAEVPVEQIVSRLWDEVRPTLQSMARQAASSEHERTREWLESRGLPKAARVAQRETFEVLRRQGLILKEASKNSHAEVGRGGSILSAPHPLPESEVIELAEACVALFEAKGQPVELTLLEMNVASGGFLLPEDAARVLEKVESFLTDEGKGGS